MRLTTRSRYGTRLLLDIARHQDAGWVCTSEIASRQNISQKYIEKLITGLRRGGLITSKRGPLGGHKLARSAGSITVGEIVRLLEEKDGDFGQNQDTIPGCSNPDSDECRTEIVWAEAANVLMKTLDSYRLGDLLSRRD
jgi:Rrf2 family protein